MAYNFLTLAKIDRYLKGLGSYTMCIKAGMCRVKTKKLGGAGAKKGGGGDRTVNLQVVRGASKRASL